MKAASRPTVIANTRDHRLPRGPRGGADPRRPDGQHGRRPPPLPPPVLVGAVARARRQRRHLGDRPDGARARSRATASGSRRSSSLVAIGVLLLILNWFFHRVYWQREPAGPPPARRRRSLAGAGLSLARQVVGLVLLGFTSVYREGFETVLFVQALTLEAGAATVLQGVALGLAATVAVGGPGRSRSSASCRTRRC